MVQRLKTRLSFLGIDKSNRYKPLRYKTTFRKVSSCSEYLDNCLQSPGATWQLTRGDLIAPVWAETLRWNYSVGSEIPFERSQAEVI